MASTVSSFRGVSLWSLLMICDGIMSCGMEGVRGPVIAGGTVIVVFCCSRSFLIWMK